MIRLVTQFDDPAARPVAATPSCCACCSCCCCCCVATMVSTATYTALNLSATATRATLPENKIYTARLLGGLTFFLVPTAIADIVLIVGLYQGEIGARSALIAMLIASVWPFVLYGLYRLAGHHQPARPSLATWLIGTTLFAAEGIFGFLLILSTGPLYLLVAAILTVTGIIIAHWLAGG